MPITNWKDHFSQIYSTEPDQYQRLVAAEDAYGELAERVAALVAGATTVVDIGAGTGRLTVPLCGKGVHVHAIDSAAPMLAVAKRRLAACPGAWTVSVADARDLPIADGWADAAVAGWVYGHFTEWHPDRWRTELQKAISEMGRVVRTGGAEIVIDTLGTAVDEPGAPNAALADYHDELERLGFQRSVLRTDYRFATVEESIELLDWFFGLGTWARDHDNPVVPEFTGWWQRTSS